MSKQTVAVVVAHPDDEVLGFGGVMANHAAVGDAVHVLILATGQSSRRDDGLIYPEELNELRSQAQKANKLLGVIDVRFESFPDNRMDSVDLLDVVKKVEVFVDQVKPQIVYTHHVGDLNIDHRVTHQATLTACRPLPGSSIHRIVTGEILSSSEYADPEDRFVPNVYVNIENSLEKKCKALAAYESEIRDWPHPRSIKALEHLAAHRGSECGCTAAEAFSLIREVI